MADYHGIIFAYSAAPEMGELVKERTSASVPFCARYRLIDFSLSSLRNAGIRNAGVIMQRDYQSLMDHCASGKAWDMTRKNGGLKLLPPFGLPEYHSGDYVGTMEALNAVATYIEDIKEDNVILMQGNLCANIDLEAAIACHEQSGAAITAICSPKAQGGVRYRYILNEDGNSSNRLLLNQTEKGEGIASLEAYILSKELLLSMMKTKQQTNVYRFHAEALFEYLNNGGKLNVYIHNGYAAFITTKGEYFKAATDILAPENRRSVFPGDRPVRTSGLEGVSSYYGAEAKSRNCLVADNCIIEGEIENCILHSGVRIAKGAKLKNCVLFRGTEVGENSELECIVADKYVKFAPGTALKGSPKLPLVIPKGAEI